MEKSVGLIRLLNSSVSRQQSEWIKAIKRNLDEHNDATSRFIQLATVSENGQPSCRTVVFRGWLRDGSSDGSFKFITDLRSSKINHITQNPMIEVCWYLPRTREQFRISAIAHIISESTQDKEAQAERINQWNSLTLSTKKQFYFPEPGQIIETNSTYYSPTAIESSTSTSSLSSPNSVSIGLKDISLGTGTPSKSNKDQNRELTEEEKAVPSKDYTLIVCEPTFVSHLILSSPILRFDHMRKLSDDMNEIEWKWFSVNP